MCQSVVNLINLLILINNERCTPTCANLKKSQQTSFSQKANSVWHWILFPVILVFFSGTFFTLKFVKTFCSGFHLSFAHRPIMWTECVSVFFERERKIGRQTHQTVNHWWALIWSVFPPFFDYQGHLFSLLWKIRFGSRCLSAIFFTGNEESFCAPTNFVCKFSASLEKKVFFLFSSHKNILLSLLTANFFHCGFYCTFNAVKYHWAVEKTWNE